MVVGGVQGTSPCLYFLECSIKRHGADFVNHHDMLAIPGVEPRRATKLVTLAKLSMANNMSFFEGCESEFRLRKWQQKDRLARGLLRIWVGGSLFWYLYCICVFSLMDCHYGMVEAFSLACHGYVPGGHSNPESSYVYYPLLLMFGHTPFVGAFVGAATLWSLSWVIRGFQPRGAKEQGTDRCRCRLAGPMRPSTVSLC